MNQEKENRLEVTQKNFPKRKLEKKTLKALLELQASWLRVSKSLELPKKVFSDKSRGNADRLCTPCTSSNLHETIRSREYNMCDRIDDISSRDGFPRNVIQANSDIILF